MTRSQNGWPVIPISTSLIPLRWITGRVLGGDVFEIFDHLGRRFQEEVEPIIVEHSWGWANRTIAGSADTSNHASATAVDFNAPAHPLGASGTFTPAQVAVIRDILRDVSPAVRWGGDYSGRKDEMHFEINTTADQVAVVAARLRGTSSSGGSAAGDPSTPEEIDMPLTDADVQKIWAHKPTGHSTMAQLVVALKQRVVDGHAPSKPLAELGEIITTLKALPETIWGLRPTGNSTFGQLLVRVKMRLDNGSAPEARGLAEVDELRKELDEVRKLVETKK